ncbi:hypothetical protein C2G38_1219648, partial [Gigaspora rosea]
TFEFNDYLFDLLFDYIFVITYTSFIIINPPYPISISAHPNYPILVYYPDSSTSGSDISQRDSNKWCRLCGDTPYFRFRYRIFLFFFLVPNFFLQIFFQTMDQPDLADLLYLTMITLEFVVLTWTPKRPFRFNTYRPSFKSKTLTFLTHTNSGQYNYNLVNGRPKGKAYPHLLRTRPGSRIDFFATIVASMDITPSNVHFHMYRNLSKIRTQIPLNHWIFIPRNKTFILVKVIINTILMMKNQKRQKKNQIQNFMVKKLSINNLSVKHDFEVLDGG